MAGPNELQFFTPVNGGLGVFLTCTTSSSRVAFPDPRPRKASTYCVNNLGLDNVFLAFGDVTIVATTAYLSFPPGLTYIGIPNAGSSDAPTHVAGITQAGSVDVQISLGSLDD